MGGLRQLSTHGYTHYGQRVDGDMCTTMPRSFPHQFTVMRNWMDRHTHESNLFFQVHASAAELG